MEQKVLAEESVEPVGQGPGLGVLEKAMGLLNIVSEVRSPMTFTELLRASRLPKATLHRILATLIREGLLRHDAYTRTYRLGFRLLELAHEVWSDFDLRLAAQDEMAQLRDTFRESVLLGVLDGDSLVVLACEEPSRDEPPPLKIGLRLPVHASALGKAVLAFLDSARQGQLLAGSALARHTPRTVTDPTALRSELDITRSRGYALEEGELDEGVSAVAVPILDMEGQPVGAISIRSWSKRMDLAQAHSLAPALMGAARRISHNAGGEFTSIEPPQAPAESTGLEVQCVAKSRALLGEGPMWSPRDSALYWVDILTPSIHRLDAATGADTEFKLGAMVSVAIPKATGGLLAATPSGLMAFDIDSRRLTLLCHPEADRPGNRYNDGKCDRLGRLWVGTLDMATAANRGNLFRVEADGAWKKMDSGFTVANGLGWSPDNRTMYFADSHRRTVYRYDFDLRSGDIANRRPLITLDSSDGRPDGLTVDEDGCLWVAIWDAWRVSRYAPDGRELMRIKLPVPRPTSCCFGGPNLDTLYITSASVRLTGAALDAAPLSGSLFAVQVPGVRGLPESMFAG
jgi:sugar lactone lactonase YvrE/DNA-binding IclR family transcriptional regulator